MQIADLEFEQLSTPHTELREEVHDETVAQPNRKLSSQDRLDSLLLSGVRSLFGDIQGLQQLRRIGPGKAWDGRSCLLLPPGNACGKRTFQGPHLEPPGCPPALARATRATSRIGPGLDWEASAGGRPRKTAAGPLTGDSTPSKSGHSKVGSPFWQTPVSTQFPRGMPGVLDSERPPDPSLPSRTPVADWRMDCAMFKPGFNRKQG